MNILVTWIVEYGFHINLFGGLLLFLAKFSRNENKDHKLRWGAVKHKRWWNWMAKLGPIPIKHKRGIIKPYWTKDYVEWKAPESHHLVMLCSVMFCFPNWTSCLAHFMSGCPLYAKVPIESQNELFCLLIILSCY